MCTFTGVADSKMLTEQKREEIFTRMADVEDSIKSVVAYAVQPLSARLIAASMLRRMKRSLNEVSHNSAIELIQAALDHDVNVVEVRIVTYTAAIVKLYDKF